VHRHPGPARCAASTSCAMASIRYVACASVPAARSGKSAITLSHVAPRPISASAQLTSSASATAVPSRSGKYRPSGARNRPAACTAGMPDSCSSCRVTPAGEPTSRTAVIPARAQAIRFARAAPASKATRSAGPASTAAWAWASTRPGRKNPPGSGSSALPRLRTEAQLRELPKPSRSHGSRPETGVAGRQACEQTSLSVRAQTQRRVDSSVPVDVPMPTALSSAYIGRVRARAWPSPTTSTDRDTTRRVHPGARIATESLVFDIAATQKHPPRPR
jgi:hypothetical protein